MFFLLKTGAVLFAIALLGVSWLRRKRSSGSTQEAPQPLAGVEYNRLSREPWDGRL